MKLTLGQIADWIHAEGDFTTNTIAQGYSIDSRTIADGELFFAVRGERFDGHDYVETALANGAVAAVVNMRWLAPANVDTCKLLRVPDEEPDCLLTAMQVLARAVRRHWGKRVIGVTGSAGKTTTKECVAQVLCTRFNVLKSAGNLNNHFGMPLQLLRLEPEHDVAVIEMGMNHAGEIAALARIAEPDWAVVSNVAAVHLEYFSDGIEGIARAKRELVDAIPPDGYAFLNGDDERVARFADQRAVLYGTCAECVVRATEVEELGLAGTRFLVKAGSLQHSVQLRLLGRHNVLNGLAAISVGLASGVPLSLCCEALEALEPTEKRGAVVEWNGARLINDCYNSNPQALNAMVATLANSAAQRRILVAGEMLELGPEAAMLHAECGRAAALAGIDFVVGVRGMAADLARAAKSAGAAALFFDTPEAAAEWLRGTLREGDLALLKGSRGVRLERAIEALGPEPTPVLASGVAEPQTTTSRVRGEG
ncbi:MAG: UDP-N-acetylmuramoyl-tripeptide--D-alanyl-D-alanine ligase [Janthinobacterium lividum]